MKRLLLSGVCLICLGLATWGTQNASGPERSRPEFVKNESATLPASFGPIQPRISPDGRRIVFSYQGAIWRVDRDGGPITRLTDGPGFDIEPCWSADGKRIFYVASPAMARSSSGAVRVIDAETGAPLALTVTIESADSMYYSKLEVHPDGRLFGNVTVDGKSAGLALVDLRTSAIQTIARPPRAARYALSRDGKWLAYTTNMDQPGQQSGNDGPQADLWMIATTGGQPVKVTRFASRVHDLCWSADGRELFLVTDLGGAHYDLWRLAIDDPERSGRRVTWGAADEDRPSVSADGRWLAYTDNRQGATALVIRELRTDVDKTVEISALDFRAPAGTFSLKTVDARDGQPVVARVTIHHAGGKFHAPAGSLYRALGGLCHFYCDRAATLSLPAGKYRIRATRGPEYRPTLREITVAPGQLTEASLELARWTNASAAGWHSGENHIHANYGYGHWYTTPRTLRRQCAGEDLRVCNFMVANSDTDGVFDREFFRGRPDALSNADTILYWNQEFRSTMWGHMTLVNLSGLVEPIFTGFQDTTNPWDVPTNADIADRTHLQKGLVNYTHGAFNPKDPYLGAYTGKGIPVDVALGKIDTLDLNMNFAAAVPLWYRLLNCGFRLPASAGTDCFLNRIPSVPPGRDRVYVKLDGPLTYPKWIDGLRAGRSFVSNGPMLELSVERQGPGGVIRRAAPATVHVVARASSPLPLARVELVCNGAVVAAGAADRTEVTIDAEIAVARSGWISLRAFGAKHPDDAGGPLEAHASPVYVEIAGKPAGSRADGAYFLAWIDRLALDLRLRDRYPSPALRQHVQNQLDAARAVYARLAKE